MADDIDLLTADGLSAQKAVIGSMLIDDRCVGAVLAKLAPEDFSDGPCRNTFRAIKAQFLAGLPVDPVLIQEKVGGGESWAKWAAEMMVDTPTAANVEHYADIVRQRAALWRLREQADKLLAATTLDEARQIVRGMSGLISDTGRMPRMTAAELAQDFIRRVTSPEKPEYLPWGIPSADKTVYAERGDLCLLGGYPSAGKTLLSVQMALAQAKRYKVVYYTLETKPEKMADRIFAYLAKLSLTAIKNRDLTQTQISKAAEAANLFVTETPIEFVRAAGSTVDDIAADAVSKGAEIIYIDYLQLIESDGRDRYSQVSAVSRGLKLFAQAHNITVVALAQLSRPEKTGKGGEQRRMPPTMQSFKESGQIEQDADLAFLLWADDPNDNGSRRVLKLGKNKEGPKFTVHMDFDGPTQTMVEAEQQPDNSAAQHYSSLGRAVKAAHRAKQVKFEEITEGYEDNPFTGGCT
jgi:replicative DNA helicase